MKETFCYHYLNKRIFMLQAIYTVLLRGKLGRNSIMYRYGLCVHIVFCLAGLKLGMSYKWPKWQRWKNKRGESWKTTIFPLLCCHLISYNSFYVSVLYCCLTLSRSVHDSFNKTNIFWFCRCKLCCGITLQVANMKRSFFTNFTNTRIRCLHQEV